MLAIIIPYFKISFFEETIQSLTNQTDKRFKVYIGDDASPENPTDLLNKYKGKFDFFYHRFETNLGSQSLTQQWDRCIELSEKEQWIMVLGDDDYLAENVVSEFYNLIKKVTSNIDLIRCKLEINKNEGQIIKNTFEYQLHEDTNRFLKRIFSLVETITASEFIFKREVYKKNNGFVEYPLAWFSDYATWLLFSKESGIYNLHNATVFWRISALNISGNHNTKKKNKRKIQSLFEFIFFLKPYVYKSSFDVNKFAFAHFKNLTNVFSIKEILKLFLITSNKNFYLKTQIFSSIIQNRITNRIKKW